MTITEISPTSFRKKSLTSYKPRRWTKKSRYEPGKVDKQLDNPYEICDELESAAYDPRIIRTFAERIKLGGKIYDELFSYKPRKIEGNQES